MFDPNDYEPSELFAMFGKMETHLRKIGVLRSSNNPTADYAEYLSKLALGLTLCPRSTKGYDATNAQGQRFEIKARRITPLTKGRQLSAIRDLDEVNFDFLIGVLFNEDYSILRVCKIPHAVVCRLARDNPRQNSSTLHLPSSLWQLASVEDLTTKFKVAALMGPKFASKRIRKSWNQKS